MHISSYVYRINLTFYLLHIENIVGVCEVMEQQLDTSPKSSSSTPNKSERERRKTARIRAVIENLCIEREYRQCGIGIALVKACEEVVQQQWSSSGHDEIFTQVEIDNTQAYQLFCKCGYHQLFEDPTCRKVEIDNDSAMFVKEAIVTKRLMRKMLVDNSEW